MVHVKVISVSLPPTSTTTLIGHDPHPSNYDDNLTSLPTDLFDVVDDEVPEFPPGQLLPGHSLRGRGSDQARFGAEDCRVVAGWSGGRHTGIISIKYCRLQTIFPS